MLASVSAATASSPRNDVALNRERTMRHTSTQMTTVISSAACCLRERRVRASSTVHKGARTVYATPCTSDASVTGRPVSALRIGVGPTIAVASASMATIAATM